jgi:hypothetical protein
MCAALAAGCGGEPHHAPPLDAADAPVGPANDAAPRDAPDGVSRELPSCDPSDGSFSIVVLPDTQFYAAAYRGIFTEQTAWILREQERCRIAFVVHEGDIVDLDVKEQWAVAAESLHALDGKVPYVLAVGNHDLGWKGGRISRESSVNEYFSLPAGVGGSYEPGRLENHYQVLEAYGTRWLVLSLEFGPRDDVVRWADGVLSQGSGLPAIIVTHAYLFHDGTRYQASKRQAFEACGYGLDDLGGCNDGQELWDKLISRHDNVAFVLSGHVLYPGLGRLTSAQPSGRQTHQLLANYQTCGSLPCTIPGTTQQTEGGDGFLRLITITPDRRSARVVTYSPRLRQMKNDAANEFSLDLDPALLASPSPRPVPRPSAPAQLLASPPPGARLSPPLSSRPPSPCDGVQLVTDATDVRRFQACLGARCERFELEEKSRACRSLEPHPRVRCVNDEGMLRLFFFDGLSARQRVRVIVEDARGQHTVREDMVPAELHRTCWTAVHSLAHW